MPSDCNLYEVLNCHPNATFNTLKCNYKELILQHHPDKSKKDVDTAINNAESIIDQNDDNYAQFVKINEAWNTLKDPVKRKLYDAELMSKKFQDHSNIFEKLTLPDMVQITLPIEELNIESKNEEKEVKKAQQQLYTYSCRCGGQYVVNESVHRRSESNLNMLTSTDSLNREVIVECSDCSLVVILEIHGSAKPLIQTL